MKEAMLHFIWRFQLLNNLNLKTTDGKDIRIIKRGLWNKIDSGPDFLMGQIETDHRIWAGSIEIHVKSSDWDLHRHSADPAYENVILHVVYEHDRKVEMLKKRNVPTLELRAYIFPEVIKNYDELLQPGMNFIPCEKSIHLVRQEKIKFWLERLVIERLERKTDEIEKEFGENQKDWERLLFKKMAYSFGLKVNSDVFEIWADSFDYKVLKKIQTRPELVQALFLGQAGFLDINSNDEYVLKLQDDYLFLSNKYKLFPVDNKIFKFSRMRPYSFPTVRLMQLATLYSSYQNLFGYLMGSRSFKKIEAVFYDLAYPDFWKNHFTLEKESSRISVKSISADLIERLIINVVIPIKFVYSKSLGTDASEELIEWLRELPAEKNSVIAGYSKLGLKAENAFESQSFLELKKHFCNQKKCLNCAIGVQILKDVR
ncbi:MAG: DUF2851 family protein [Moheibacter sp.]